MSSLDFYLYFRGCKIVLVPSVSQLILKNIPKQALILKNIKAMLQPAGLFTFFKKNHPVSLCKCQKAGNTNAIGRITKYVDQPASPIPNEPDNGHDSHA
jgi:hypothetical protein